MYITYKCLYSEVKDVGEGNHVAMAHSLVNTDAKR